MNETCMKHALNMPNISGCPFCRIESLEAGLHQAQQMIGGDMIIAQIEQARILELEQRLNEKNAQIVSIVENMGDQRLELEAKIQELKTQLCEWREWSDQDEVHIEKLEQQLEDEIYRVTAAIKSECVGRERVDKLQEQNAKLAQANRLLVEALENLMEWQVKNVKKWHNRAYDEAAAVLKEVKGD